MKQEVEIRRLRDNINAVLARGIKNQQTAQAATMMSKSLSWALDELPDADRIVEMLAEALGIPEEE